MIKTYGKRLIHICGLCGLHNVYELPLVARLAQRRAADKDTRHDPAALTCSGCRAAEIVIGANWQAFYNQLSQNWAENYPGKDIRDFTIELR
jgi:hypothetical protein